PKLVPVARPQRSGAVPPQAPPVLEVDGPAPIEMAVHRGLGIDRDVLVEGGPPLLRRVPLERALGVLAAPALAVADLLQRGLCACHLSSSPRISSRLRRLAC